jgi:prolyl-tRNA editing enzyme YbaK/EbsC (Cys-tRNA(Pro) deacylase)
MSLKEVKAYFKQYEMEVRIIESEESSATVELAAKALNCEPERIAKSLSFHLEDRVILIVAAGDAKVDNRKFRDEFGVKAKMLKGEEVEPLIGCSELIRCR